MFIVLQEILKETINLFVQMAPYLLFGFIVSGFLYVLIPRSLIIKHLKPNKTSSIFKAALLGIPLPLCSCGVIPVAAHLRKQGASKSATVSFLASTPSTGADSILATYSLMGPIYAIFRPIDALFSGLLAGMLVKIFNAEKQPQIKLVTLNIRKLKLTVTEKANILTMQTISPLNISPQSVTLINSCCASNDIPAKSGCCSSKEEETTDLTIAEKIKKAFHYGLFELVDDTKKWILIGIVVGGILSWGIPSELESYWVTYPALSYLSMLLIGLPMYVCATASIPIATALLVNGLSPGAALVFLAVGPATNTATMAFLSSSMGKKNMFIYVFSISFSAILLGIIIDLFFGQQLKDYFQTTAQVSHIDLIDYAFSVVLAGLMLFQYAKKLKK